MSRKKALEIDRNLLVCQFYVSRHVIEIVRPKSRKQKGEGLWQGGT